MRKNSTANAEYFRSNQRVHSSNSSTDIDLLNIHLTKQGDLKEVELRGRNKIESRHFPVRRVQSTSASIAEETGLTSHKYRSHAQGATKRPILQGAHVIESPHSVEGTSKQQFGHCHYYQQQEPRCVYSDRPKLSERIRSNQEQHNTSDGHTATVEPKTFPFHYTPSGNLKVVPNQVVFESKKVSILVADPKTTELNLDGLYNHPDCGHPGEGRSQDYHKTMDGYSTESKDEYCSSIDELHDMNGSLSPEINLERLGITNTASFSWDKVSMHAKTNLHEELNRRITNYILADCVIYIGNEEFFCHLIVLQCYSHYFESITEKKVDLTKQTEVTPKAFALIYGWMISHQEDSYKLLSRDNCLEMFSAAKYLGIKELEEQCWMFIDSDEVFNEETAFLLFMEAKTKGHGDVMQLMVPRIRKFFLTLVSSQDFLELSVDDVCGFLSSNYIYINCEMEVLMSAVRWLRYDWKTREKYLVDLMKCVRFGWIEPWQLIDVKRNPENPEFIAIMKHPEVSRMVDDGLAFVIIKYWYGHKNDDFQHWLDVLGLEEPVRRNLSGQETNYITYRQFLDYLDSFRSEALMGKSIPKPAASQKFHQPRATSHKDNQPVDDGARKQSSNTTPPVPTMDEMLASRKLNMHHGNFRRDHVSHEERMAGKGVEKNSVPINEPSHETLEVENESHHQHHHHHQPSPEVISHMSSAEQSAVVPEQQRNARILSMYNTAQTNANELSASILGPQTKNYLVEGSLFAPDRETVLVFGGIDPHSQYGIGRNTGKDVYRYIPESNTWEFVTELPEPRHHHSVTMLKGRVFLVGGADPREDDVHGKSVVVSTVWSFEPVHRAWFSECGMLTPRKNLGLVVNRQKMYAIGGQDRNGRVLASMERYDTDSAQWVEVAPLRYPRMGAAYTKYRDFIWVAGGMTGSKKHPLTSDVECYDPKNNEWTHLTCLRFPRCFSRLFVMNDTLYMIGGAGRINEKDKTTTSVEAIDVWSNKDKEWHLLTEMAIPRHGHAVAYIGTQILMIGGVTTVYMRALSNVECYCVERNTWIRGVAGLPTTLSGHGAVTLPPASLM